MALTATALREFRNQVSTELRSSGGPIRLSLPPTDRGAATPGAVKARPSEPSRDPHAQVPCARGPSAPSSGSSASACSVSRSCAPCSGATSGWSRRSCAWPLADGESGAKQLVHTLNLVSRLRFDRKTCSGSPVAMRDVTTLRPRLRVARSPRLEAGTQTPDDGVALVPKARALACLYVQGTNQVSAGRNRG
jgi:hypothetical protein